MPYLFEELTEEEENELRRAKAASLRRDLAAKAVLSGVFSAARLKSPEIAGKITQAQSLANRGGNAVSAISDPVTRKLAEMLVDLDDRSGQHGVDAIDWALRKKEEFVGWFNRR